MTQSKRARTKDLLVSIGASKASTWLSVDSPLGVNHTELMSKEIAKEMVAGVCELIGTAHPFGGGHPMSMPNCVLHNPVPIT